MQNLKILRADDEEEVEEEEEEGERRKKGKKEGGRGDEELQTATCKISPRGCRREGPKRPDYVKTCRQGEVEREEGERGGSRQEEAEKSSSSSESARREQTNAATPTITKTACPTCHHASSVRSWDLRDHPLHRYHWQWSMDGALPTITGTSIAMVACQAVSLALEHPRGQTAAAKLMEWHAGEGAGERAAAEKEAAPATAKVRF